MKFEMTVRCTNPPRHVCPTCKNEEHLKRFPKPGWGFGGYETGPIEYDCCDTCYGKGYITEHVPVPEELMKRLTEVWEDYFDEQAPGTKEWNEFNKQVKEDK